MKKQEESLRTIFGIKGVTACDDGTWRMGNFLRGLLHNLFVSIVYGHDVLKRFCFYPLWIANFLIRAEDGVSVRVPFGKNLKLGVMRVAVWYVTSIETLYVQVLECRGLQRQKTKTGSTDEEEEFGRFRTMCELSVCKICYDSLYQ